MRWTLLLSMLLVGALYCVGCQITVDDIRPFELRKGGGESVEPEPEPKQEPKPSGKDVIYALALHGID